MMKLKSSNTYQVSPFMSSQFAKALAECNVPLEWIKNRDMLAMVKNVKNEDEE